MGLRGRKSINLISSTKDGWEVVSTQGTTIEDRKVLCKCVSCGSEKVFGRYTFLDKKQKLKKCEKCHPIIRETSERNKEIVHLLNTSKITLDEVGIKYGLTKERVRQIYERGTGDNRGYIHRWEENIGKEYGVFTVISYNEKKEVYNLECDSGHKKSCNMLMCQQLKLRNRCGKCYSERNNKRNKKIYTLYSKGVKLKDIADKFNITVNNLNMILYRYYTNRNKRKPFGHKEEVKC